MKEDYDDFYAENEEFVNDIREYYSNIRTEFIHIINEVSGYKMVCEFIGIGMIPYKPGTNGVLLDDKNNIEFECDDFRAVIGSGLPKLKKIFEYESENAYYLDDEQLNLKRCEIYYENKRNDVFIRRHGGVGNSSGCEVLLAKMKRIINSDEGVFVSNWVEYGAFCVFIVSKLSGEDYLNYRELSNTNEDNDNTYKFFLDTLINNFYEKWLEFIYYGLKHSTINFISDSQAIITASANDMFQSRHMPTEHIFTKIANYEYERASCKGKIVFSDNIDKIIRFKNPIQLSVENAKKIRKLLEMSNENTCLIATLSGGEIVGLGDYEKNKNTYLLEFVDINMWNLSFNKIYIVKYINGQYRLPENKFDSELFLKICKEKYNDQYDKNIIKIINSASMQKHGTMVVISPTAKEESEALVGDCKGTAIHEINLIEESEDLILGLCSIDGAIMIDPFGNCSGIGLILSNPNSGKGNPERGSRYNSAVNYINNRKNSIAIVISEDGMIDIKY